MAVLVATVTALLGAVATGAILVGAAWHTVSRWLRFMQCGLAAHPQWQASRGRLPAEISLPRMPVAVIEVFGPIDSAQTWCAALQWLSPITTAPLFSSRTTRAG
jgi:hypothetical protein